MKLGVAERLMLMNLLPGEGNVLTLRIVRDLQSDLGFSEDELRDLNLGNEVEFKCPHCQTVVASVVPPDFCPSCKGAKPLWERGRSTGRTLWDGKADQGKEVEIGPRSLALIAEKLEALDKDGKLTMNQLALYEKFVENKAEEPKE